jgi:hypothetical protein
MDCEGVTKIVQAWSALRGRTTDAGSPGDL